MQSLGLISRYNNPLVTQQPRKVKPICNVGFDSFGNMYNTFRTRWGQAFTNFVSPFSTLFGRTIVGCRFYFRRLGSPTGTLFCRVYKDSDNSLQRTFGQVNVATVPLGVTPYDFWTANYTVPADDVYYLVVEYTGGDVSNRIEVAFLNGQGFDSTFTRLAFYDAVPAWNVSSGQDVAGIIWVR